MGESIQKDRITNRQLAALELQGDLASPALATSFLTVPSTTQRNSFQCAIYCIGNIAAEAAGRKGRVRNHICENTRIHIGLFLWLNSSRPIALSQGQANSFLSSPYPEAIEMANPDDPLMATPGPRAQELISFVIGRR